MQLRSISKNLLLVLLLLHSAPGKAQNFLRNPGFENIRNNPPIKFYQGPGGFDKRMQDWYSASNGTPDVLHYPDFWPEPTATPDSGNCALGHKPQLYGTQFQNGKLYTCVPPEQLKKNRADLHLTE